MKKLYTLLSLLGLVSLSTAQSFQWLGNGGGNNTLDNEVQENVIDLKTDSQRNVYLLSYVSRLGASVAGTPVTTYDAGGGGDNQDFILVSYSCTGAYRWHKVFGGGGYDLPSGLVIDSQDNVYVSGYVSECGPSTGLYYSEARIGDNNGVDYSFGNSPTNCRNPFLTKFTSTGVFQWIHFPYIHMPYSGTNPGPSRFLHIVNDEIYWAIKLPPGSYEGGQVVNSDTTVPYREYLLKYNTSGIFTGSVLFDIKINTSNGFPIQELRWYRNPYNGNYYVRYDNSGGQSTETLTVGGTAINAFLPKIICFNAQGQYLWHRGVTGAGFYLTGLAFSPQHVYVAGQDIMATSSINFLGWSAEGISGLGSVTFIMKCPQDMSSYEWISHNNPTGGLSGILHYAPNTDVLYYGFSLGFSPFVWGSQSIAGPGANNGTDPLLAQFNTTTGACTSLVRIPGTNGYSDEITAITQDAAGDLVVGGYMGLNLTVNGTTYTYNGGNTDYFVAKYANQPCQPLALDQTDLSNLVYTYPNPTQNTVTLQNLPITCNYTIHNLLGQTLQTGTLTPTQNQLTLQSLPQGYYNLLLTQNGAVVYKTLLIKN